MLAATILLCAAAMPARADCIDDAALRHHVNAHVLRAIGWHESRLQPLAIGHNANGTVDIGAFQINDVHLPELAHAGIATAALVDGCVSAEVAAWHYRRQVDALGNTWAAVGAYHSRTPAREAGYANEIAALLMHWRVLPDGPLPFDNPAIRPPADAPSSAQPRAHPARAKGPGARAGPTTTAAAADTSSPAGLSPSSWRQTPGGSVPDAVAFGTRAFSTLAFVPSIR